MISIAHAALDNAKFGAVINPIIDNFVTPAITLVFGIAVLVFVYGVLQMVISGGDADARAKGRWAIFGGIIGMFIMVSAWGIINLVSNTVSEFK